MQYKVLSGTVRDIHCLIQIIWSQSSWGFGAELHKHVVLSGANINSLQILCFLDVIHRPVFI
jgi:hypothetical protein